MARDGRVRVDGTHGHETAVVSGEHHTVEGAAGATVNFQVQRIHSTSELERALSIAETEAENVLTQEGRVDHAGALGLGDHGRG